MRNNIQNRRKADYVSQPIVNGLGVWDRPAFKPSVVVTLRWDAIVHIRINAYKHNLISKATKYFTISKNSQRSGVLVGHLKSTNIEYSAFTHSHHNPNLARLLTNIIHE
jgi:hypothetical protein